MLPYTRTVTVGGQLIRFRPFTRTERKTLASQHGIFIPDLSRDNPSLLIKEITIIGDMCIHPEDQAKMDEFSLEDEGKVVVDIIQASLGIGEAATKN